MDLFELEHCDIENQLKLDKIINLTLAHHSPLIYTINKIKKGRKEGVASAVYVSYLGEKYIISAGHTFSKYSYKKTYIQGVDFSFETDCKGIIFLPQTESFNTLCDYYEMDYGIFKLTSKGIAKIEKLYVPFPISPDVKSYQYNGLFHFVFGYPSSQNVQSSIRKPYVGKYTNFRLPTLLEGITENNFKKDKNIALMFTIDNSIRTKNLKRKSYGRAPKPNGLSGCGIWAIPSYPHSEGSYSLQGMITHYDDRKNLLIGFRIQDIVEMIELVNHELIKFDFSGEEDNIKISIPKKQLKHNPWLEMDRACCAPFWKSVV